MIPIHLSHEASVAHRYLGHASWFGVICAFGLRDLVV